MIENINPGQDISPSTPRILELRAISPTTLLIRWRDGGSAEIDLAQWVVSGGEILRPLRDPEVFQRATIGSHGAAVEWGQCDIAIDAMHLEMLARESTHKIYNRKSNLS